MKAVKIVAIVLCLLISVEVIAAENADIDKALNFTDSYRQAKQAESEGNIEKAKAVYEDLLSKLSPLNGVKLDLARLYYKDEQYHQAKKLLEEILSGRRPKGYIKRGANELMASINEVIKDQPFVPVPVTRPARSGEAPSMGTKIAEERAVEAKIARIAKARTLETKLAKIVEPSEQNEKPLLDEYFQKAKQAESRGNSDQAIEAYKQMLAIDPSLSGVRLDLALLYQKDKQYHNAKDIYEAVLKNNPPENVKNNVNLMLSFINALLNQHDFSGSISIGDNWDSNANSAAGSNQITFSGVSIPLDPTSQGAKDNQVFLSASLSYAYKFNNPDDKDISPLWRTTATYYQTEQANLDNLNLILLSLRTGPEFDFRKHNTNLSFGAGYNYIKLDSHEYLYVTYGDASIKYRMTDRLSFQLDGVHEHRHFINSPTSTVLTEKTGTANQAGIKGTYIISSKDVLSAGVTWREEDTNRIYNDFSSTDYTGSYTRVLPWDSFAVTTLGLKKSNYDGPDPLVSPTLVRDDNDRNVSFTLGRKFGSSLSATLGYTFRKVESNIQNFDYDNHRVSSSISWSFQ